MVEVDEGWRVVEVGGEKWFEWVRHLSDWPPINSMLAAALQSEYMEVI